MKKKTKDSDISREARTEEVAFPNLPPYSNEGWRDVPPMWVGVEEVGQQNRQQMPKGERELKKRYGRGEKRKQGR